MRSPKSYVESGDHLPKPLKDFHNMKDVFKLLHRKYGEAGTSYYKGTACEINWMDGSCYVVDWFLWFMAQRGWAMQRSRAKVEFTNLSEEIAEFKKENADAFFKYLEERKQCQNQNK